MSTSISEEAPKRALERPQTPGTLVNGHGPVPFPSGETLPLAEILDEVTKAIKTYVHFATDEQVWAVALWVAHTHILDNFDVSPRLAIRAPSKQSGKTRLMEVTNELTHRGWHVVSPTPAVTFRKIEKEQPTILLDEADQLFERRAEDKADLIQLLNTGHARGSVVPRCVGPKMELHDFTAFAAVALAGIGTNWSDTILDRSIVINMERKTSAEPVARLKRPGKAKLRLLGKELADSLREHVKEFDYSDPPDELSDRAQEGWEPLQAIAQAAGNDWPSRAKKAAIDLSGAEAWGSEERNELILLRDMRAIFLSQGDPEFLPSKLILPGVLAITESPWNNPPHPLNFHGIGKMMGQFGIKSGQKTRGEPKGYFLADIKRHWTRLGTDSDESLADLITAPSPEESTDEPEN